MVKTTDADEQSGRSQLETQLGESGATPVNSLNVEIT